MGSISSNKSSETNNPLKYFLKNDLKHSIPTQTWTKPPNNFSSLCSLSYPLSLFWSPLPSPNTSKNRINILHMMYYPIILTHNKILKLISEPLRQTSTLYHLENKPVPLIKSKHELFLIIEFYCCRIEQVIFKSAFLRIDNYN